MPWITLPLVLTMLGCRPAGQPETQGAGVSSGLGTATGTVGTSQTSGTSSGVVTSASPTSGTASSVQPACYTLHRPAGSYQWTVSRVPTVNGVPLSVHATFNIEPTAGNNSESLAFFDGSWWSCNNDFVAIHDPATGVIDHTSHPCYSVLAFPTELGVQSPVGSIPQVMEYFASTSDFLADNPTRTSQESWLPKPSDAETDGVTLWSASSGQLSVLDLVTGSEQLLPLVEFESDRVIRGVGELGGSVWVLDDGRGNADDRIRVHEYDPASGTHLSAVEIGQWTVDTARGLWCGVP